MKKLRIDWNVVGTIIIIIGMTLLGVHYMEYDWCEWASGAIWIAGELMIVCVMAFKPMMRFIMDETKRIYEKMLED